MTLNNYDYYISNGTTVNFTFKVQLEKSASATSWEPYTNGPAPNPDYPMPVNVVTGDNTIKVIGKNLFDKDSATYRNGYLKDDNGNETSSGQSGYLSSYVSVKPNTQYTIQGTLTTGTNTTSYRLYYYDSSKNWISRTSSITGTNTTYTFTTPNNCYFMQFQYITANYDANTIMINEGTTASYVPYQSQTYPINLGSMELCKIGDYQDYLYKENGVWYKYGAIGKVVLDGSESGWNTYNTATALAYLFVVSDITSSVVL